MFSRTAIPLLAFASQLTQALNNGMFLTPPMGWLNWQTFRCETDCDTYPDHCVNEQLFMNMADRMAIDGWKDAGYNWINVDDCWASMQRDQGGKLTHDTKRFPSGMKALGDYIHNKGLKYGIYSDVGDITCAKYPASLGHYELDAQTFADWGVDSLKFDGCNLDITNFEDAYPEMTKALNKTGRPMAYICVPGPYTRGDYNHTFMAQHCNQVRTINDVDDEWLSVDGILDFYVRNQDVIAPAAGPGAWNDPDMLVIGGYGLTTGQSRIQMALWSIMASPLLMGNDMRTISDEAREILLNRDVIAVNQDPLGIQGKRVLEDGNVGVELWTRPLKDGDLAVAVVRRKKHEPYFPAKYDLDFTAVGWKNDKAYVRDLFQKKTLGELSGAVTVSASPFDVVMLRLSQNPFPVVEVPVEAAPAKETPSLFYPILIAVIVAFAAIIAMWTCRRRRNYSEIA